MQVYNKDSLKTSIILGMSHRNLRNWLYNLIREVLNDNHHPCTTGILVRGNCPALVNENVQIYHGNRILNFLVTQDNFSEPQDNCPRLIFLQCCILQQKLNFVKQVTLQEFRRCCLQVTKPILQQMAPEIVLSRPRQGSPDSNAQHNFSSQEVYTCMGKMSKFDIELWLVEVEIQDHTIHWRRGFLNLQQLFLHPNKI